MDLKRKGIPSHWLIIVTVTVERKCNGGGLNKEREYDTLLRHGYSTELRALSSPKFTLGFP